MITRVLDFLEISSHLTLALLLPFLTHRVWANIGFLRTKTRHFQTQELNKLPRVSVLVPARNEAVNIHACISALCGQDYADFEVVVLNDASTDTTGEQLDALALQFPQLRVFHSSANPPPGWNGKSYACHRLYQEATGSWLLFTDADTIHTPHSIAKGIAQSHGLQAHFLSAFPHQKTQSWSEQLMVSFIMDFLPLIGLDLKAMWYGSSEQVAANGQYILVEYSCYQVMGGHEAIFSELVDDFALAKRFQSHGYRTAFVDGTEMLTCRMYQNFTEVWNGFSKNILLGLEQSSGRSMHLWKKATFPWLYVCLFFFPYLWLLIGRQRTLAMVELSWLSALRGLVIFHFKRPLSEVITTPLAALGVIVLSLSDISRRLRKREIRWKDRFYRV